MSSVSTSLPITPTVNTPATYTNPVANTASVSGLSKTAAQLGLEASVVATLGGSTATTPLYNGVGLLNAFAQAHPQSSTAASSAPASTSSSGQTNINANWASILKAYPSESATVAADSTDQAIVAGLSVTA